MKVLALLLLFFELVVAQNSNPAENYNMMGMFQPGMMGMYPNLMNPNWMQNYTNSMYPTNQNNRAAAPSAPANKDTSLKNQPIGQQMNSNDLMRPPMWNDPQRPIAQPPRVAPPITNNMCQGSMDGILFQDPEFCDRYVECQRGNIVRRICQAGTLFDLNLFYCFAANFVDCASRRKPEWPTARPPVIPPVNMPTPDAEIHHIICRGVRNGLLIANPTNCRAYVECRDGFRLDRECRNGELFDAVNRICLTDFSVDCSNRPITPQVPQPGPDIINICRNMPTGTRASNPNSCGSYFECRNTMRIEIACPTGQSFDVDTNQCRQTAVVNCGSRPNQQNSNAVCQGQRNGRRFSNPNDCRSFIECQGNIRIDRACDNGQLFDMRLEVCLPAINVNCANRPVAQAPEDFFQFCNRTGIYFQAYPHDCSKYFVCVNGLHVTHSCGEGVHFNPQSLQCELQSRVRCDSTVITPPNPQMPVLPECTESNRFLPHLINCTQYYNCVSNIPILMSCPQGTMWNNRRSTCERTTGTQNCARSFDSDAGSYQYEE